MDHFSTKYINDKTFFTKSFYYLYIIYKNVNESYVLDQRQSYIVFIPKRTLKNARYSSLIFVHKGILS